MLRLLVVSVSGVLISSLLPKPVPNWFTCVIFRARSQMKQSKSSFVVMASSIRWLLSPTLIFPMFSTVLVWPRTCRLQAASPAMVFVCGIKASFTSSRCAARLVIAFKTVLLVVSDIVAVSLGIWLASVPPFNRLLLPLPLIPFLLFLHATDSVSVSGADPSMSADEKENRISLTFPPMSLVPVQRVLSLVPTSVLVSTSRRLAASASPRPSSRLTLESSAESSVDLQDNELDELQSQSDSPSPSRSPFLLLQSPILHLQSLLLQSPLFPASLSLFLLLKSPFLLLQSLLAAYIPTGGFPAVLVLVMLSSNVLILKFSGTLVLSPAPLKKCIRPPLSIRSFREICSSSGSQEESIFYAVWVYCFWKCCWPPAFWSAC